MLMWVVLLFLAPGGVWPVQRVRTTQLEMRLEGRRDGVTYLASLVTPSWRPQLSSSAEAFLTPCSWVKLRFSQMEVIVDEQSSSPHKNPQRALQLMPLWGSYLACLPSVQTIGCKLDHFSMVCWNLLPLGHSPSIVNILIPLGSFC